MLSEKAKIKASYIEAKQKLQKEYQRELALLKKESLLERLSKNLDKKLLKLCERFEHKAEDLRWKLEQPDLYQAEVEINKITNYLTRLEKKKKLSKKDYIILEKTLKSLNNLYGLDPDGVRELTKQAERILDDNKNPLNLKVDFSDLEKIVDSLLKDAISNHSER